jgi:hypothetical protein
VPFSLLPPTIRMRSMPNLPVVTNKYRANEPPMAKA